MFPFGSKIRARGEWYGGSSRKVENGRQRLGHHGVLVNRRLSGKSTSRDEDKEAYENGEYYVPHVSRAGRHIGGLLPW